MKIKIFLAILFAALFFTACEPNEDINDALAQDNVDLENRLISWKGLENAPVAYTLTEANYATIANQASNPRIAELGAFPAGVNQRDYIPSILAAMYRVGDYTNQSVFVTYHVHSGESVAYLNNVGSAVAYTLTTEDYDSMGTASGQPGQYDNFSSSAKPENYLPDFLATKYPDASSDDVMLITYKYYSGSVSTVSAYYYLNGTVWTPLSAYYTLTTEDYDSMGTAVGQPGQHNNFSSSILPENYLPTFLKIKFPYATSGTRQIVLYAYYNSGLSTLAKAYMFNGDTWVEINDATFVSAKAEQYLQNDNNEWVFDPTIKFTMTKSDYQLIVDAVKLTAYSDLVNAQYNNAEFYTGASAYCGNFDLRLSKRETQDDFIALETEDEKLALIQTRLIEGLVMLLKAKYPTAVGEIDGLPVYYEVTYAYYDGVVNGTDTKVFKCTKNGPDPEFALK